MAAAAESAPLAAHQALWLRDVSRFDAIVSADEMVQFLEVNVAPGMTETSMTPMAIAAAGRDLGETCWSLLMSVAKRAEI